VRRRSGIVAAAQRGGLTAYSLASADVAGLMHAARKVLTQMLAGTTQR